MNGVIFLKKPQYHIMTEPRDMSFLEDVARVCYKSEDKKTKGSADKLISAIVKSGHESIIEHEYVSVKVVTDRAIANELVRHRIASYAQESTRYVNYGKRPIAFMVPPIFLNKEESPLYKIWKESMESNTIAYNELIDRHIQPQYARNVLPLSTKTEIVMTLNHRSWRNFFKLRAAKDAHPQMRQLAIPMLQSFIERYPILYSDIGQMLQDNGDLDNWDLSWNAEEVPS